MERSEKTETETVMLKRFIAYYRPHRVMFTLDMGASLLVALIGVVYPMITRSMLNDLIPGRKYSLIIWSGLLLLGLYAMKMLLIKSGKK